jgi:iron complex transport system substrate-binding protein
MRAAGAAALCWLVAATAGAAEIVDATGTKVAVPAHASRIVTLAPSLGELAADLDTEHLERVIGVSEYSDFPPALKKVPTIGPYHRFNLEKVVSLKPDLVLATKDGNAEDQIQHLRELGITVVVVDSSSFEWVGKSMRMAAEAMGVASAGEKMAAAFARGLSVVRGHSKGRPAKRVLLQLGEDPLIVAGGENFLNEALAAIGATNAYADSRARYPRPALEDAIARNPDVILVLALGEDRAVFEKMAGHWGEFGKLNAVKSGSVRVLRADPLLRPTLRLLQGLEALEGAVYGAK